MLKRQYAAYYTLHQHCCWVLQGTVQGSGSESIGAWDYFFSKSAFIYIGGTTRPDIAAKREKETLAWKSTRHNGYLREIIAQIDL